MAKKGTLRWLNKTTGYGLIRPDGRGRDLFVRTTDMVIDEAEQPLEAGAEVSYEVKQGANGMRAIAVSRRRRYSWRVTASSATRVRKRATLTMRGLKSERPSGRSAARFLGRGSYIGGSGPFLFRCPPSLVRTGA